MRLMMWWILLYAMKIASAYGVWEMGLLDIFTLAAAFGYALVGDLIE